MNRVYEIKNCNGCNTCLNLCPKKCIEMKPNKEGFLYPIINDRECINCGICYNKCPTNNISKKKANDVKISYYALNKDDAVRLDSSSGGVFNAIAGYIISIGGYVCGAIMDDTNKIKHILTNDFDDLQLLRKSKYVQSDLNNVFDCIKGKIKEKKFVLFCGTPCQVAGLKQYIGNSPLLFTVDFICHGVPSLKVWRSYLNSLEEKYNSEISEIKWRSKKNGWINFGNEIIFENKQKYFGSINEDPFLKSFNENLFLRPSCYCCDFKGLDRDSDITLCDLWGVNIFDPDINDDRGISGMLINSENGIDMLRKISDFLSISRIDIDLIKRYNPQINESAELNQSRNNFFAELQKSGFAIAYKKYGPDRTVYKLNKKIKYYRKRIPEKIKGGLKK